PSRVLGIHADEGDVDPTSLGEPLRARDMPRPHRNRELRHVHRMRYAQPMLAHMLDMLGPRVDERHILARLRHVGAGITPDRARPDDGYLVAHGLLRGMGSDPLPLRSLRSLPASTGSDPREPSVARRLGR